MRFVAPSRVRRFSEDELVERANNITDRAQPFAHAWSQLHSAVRARRYDHATSAARTGWFTLLSGPAHEVAPVLEPVPPSELDRHPLLSALLGHAQVSIPARRPLALRRLAQAEAEASLPGGPMPAIDRALILVGQADVHRRLGRMEAAVAAGRAALDALDGSTPEGGAEVRALEEVYGHLGMSLLSSGARQLALQALEEGALVSELSGRQPAAALLAALALVAAVDGDLPAARGYVEQVLQLRPPVVGRDAALLKTARSILDLDTIDREEAARRATAPWRDTGADPAPQWVAAAAARAMLHWLSGYPGRALASLEHTAKLHGREGRTIAVRSALAPLRAALQLALGHPDAAVAVLDRDATRSVARALEQARIELVLGRHGAALAQLRSVSVAELPTRELAEAAALEAAALLRFSTGPRVEAIVDHLGSVLAATGLRLPLRMLPASDFGRVSDALAAAGYGEALGLHRLVPLLPGIAEEMLTRRETAVLTALLEHSSHAAIAAALNVSVNTVKSQLRSVYRKLGVSTRDEAIAVALDRHLVVERE
ncbi:LuxR family transcriptional regulator [Leifsonia sp. ku-ls]|nr:LuxR family transcriptional regulator [Leifsonia sp. ku-ls]